jgi:DNA polymerase-3 subunit beta
LSFGVNGKLFSDIIKNIASETVSLSMKDENMLKIKAGRKTLNINVCSAEIFPIAPRYENFTFLPIDNLISAIDSVIYAASTDETQLLINSVFVNKSEVVALDRRRMAIVPIPKPIPDSFVLPSSSVAKMKKILPLDNLEYSCSDSFIHFRQGSTAVSIRPIAKDYPKYQGVIPNGPYDVAKVKKEAFSNALKLVSIMADKQLNAELKFEDGLLKVSTKNNDTGIVEDEIEAESYKNMHIKFNAGYLADIVKHLKKDIIEIELRAPNTAVIIREDGGLHVVMPKIN